MFPFSMLLKLFFKREKSYAARFRESIPQEKVATVEAAVETTRETPAAADETITETQVPHDRAAGQAPAVQKQSTRKELNRAVKKAAQEMAFCLNGVSAGSTSEKEIIKSFREVVKAQPRLRRLKYYTAVAKLLYKEENDPACLAQAGDEEAS